MRRKADIERILSQIHGQYRPFFKVHSRVSSKRHVAVIEPSRYEEFLEVLSKDPAVPQNIKILFFLIVSAGLRITEALSLRRSSFEIEDGELYFYNKVLKKRDVIERKSIVHPAVASQVKEHLLKFRQFDKIFSIDRHQALYQIKKAFGEALDLHALRHSHISYLIFEKGFSAEEVEALISLNRDTVAFYAHKDPSQMLKELYRSSTNRKKIPSLVKTRA